MKKIVLIGDPVEHSLSPKMQNAAFRALNIQLHYEALRIPKNSFEKEIHRVLHNPEIVGANITSPFKEKIINFINPDELSSNLRSVNTIHKNQGTWLGYNSDVYGAEIMLKELKMAGKQGLIIGNGGAGRAVSHALKLLNGNPITIRRDNIEELYKYAPKTHLIVNATGSDEIEISWPEIPPEIIVVDLRYNPPNPDFLKTSKGYGRISINGFQMLLHQGAKSFEIWTSQKAPTEAMNGVLV